MSVRLLKTHAKHAADAVFEQLAEAILTGTLAPGSALPPEREIAEGCGTSRIIARQAIHRLAALRLVNVRQGGKTTVLDPQLADNFDVLELFYRLRPPSDWSAEQVFDVVEKQYLQGFCLLRVANRHADNESRRALHAEVGERAPTATDEHSITDLERFFWTEVARMGGNRIYIMEVGWWYRVFGDAHPRPKLVASAPAEVRAGFCVELARRLAEHDEPLEYYQATTDPILASMEGAR